LKAKASACESWAVAAPVSSTTCTSKTSRFVDPLSYQYLDGTEIDYVEGANGSGFKFGNPNVSGTCGCGSSFQA
jgi:iron-sulfur cluster assembly accessory protein